MSSGEKPQFDEQLVIRYLLGEVPEADAERLDELSVVDDEFAGRVTAVESDLVDAYVRGELPAETRERFQAHYLSSRRGREKVDFAEALMTQCDHAAIPASAGQPGFRWRWLPSSPALAFATTLLLIAAGWLLYQNSILRTQLTQARPERVIEQPAKANPPEQHAPAALAVVLLPQTRGSGPLPSIAIPPGADHADFQLELESSGFGEYRVGLKDLAANRIVWRSDTLKVPRGETKLTSQPAREPSQSRGITHWSFPVFHRMRASC